MSGALFSRLLGMAIAISVALAWPTHGMADDAMRNEFYSSLAGNAPGPSRVESEPTEPTALLVSGVIGPGSYEEFRAALSGARPELVVLDGPGGILGEALLIGQEVRRLKLNTMVGPNRSCASACAVVFLSGRVKYMANGASVGLHSASYADGRADPEATELMARYLRDMGVPSSTLKRMARTAPKDIRWLTRAEQKAMGIRTVASR
jgi:membrane-bound ClpP family serine protease